ncbi:MAG: type II secretion system protein N [Candidatus Thiodiazotropha sp. (ex Monitilora ramsayi)]|nr:type II secretion system protein N [Candidatus Thiodiazotropha sp. (ex Monitilora ramsayi)]
MRVSAWITLGIASYLLFLIFNFPAQQAIGWVSASDIRPPVEFMGASGTVWSGGADRVVYRKIPLGKVKWHFRPANLLLGRLAYEIELTDAGQKITGVAKAGLAGGYRLEQVEGLLLANRIPQLIGQNQLNINGKVDLNDLSLDYEDGRLTSTEGRIRWLDASVASPINLQVGDLQADLSTDDTGSINAQIKDLKGTTRIKAEVSLKNDGNFQVDGTVKPGSQTDPGLNAALSAIARSKPDGSFQLKYSGRI